MTSHDNAPDLNEDPNVIAARAERDLNTYEAKTGHVGENRKGIRGKGPSDSTTESGVNDDVEAKFPGAKVTYGSAASGAGDNREITDEEGGGINKDTGRQTKAGDFEGVGGPEDQRELAEMERPGDQDVQGNVRQHGGDSKKHNPPGS